MISTNDQRAVDTALDYIKQAQSYLMPALIEQRYERDETFSLKSEEQENPSYGFDDVSNRILFKTLAEHGFDCHVFSEEEHTWKTIGNSPKHFVICDPFCNSSLASRTFRDSAVAICVSNLDGQFAACAIGDLQTKRIYFADQNGAYVLEDYDQKNGMTSKIHVSAVNTIEDAFIATPLLKSSRRIKVKSMRFFSLAKTIHGADGAITIARLAGGYIDAYLDPSKGQPLYEVPCCELIIKAGGIVTDKEGRPFQLSEIISKLTTDKSERYKIVAACSRDLHNALLNDLILTDKNEQFEDI